MTTVDPRQQVTAAVRSEVAALRGRPGPATAKAKGGHGDAARRAGGLPGPLAQRIGAISPDDPQRKAKAFRVFLESALLDAFGSGLIHDAGFPGMVEAVHSRMQGDAQLAVAAEELACYLLEAAHG